MRPLATKVQLVCGAVIFVLAGSILQQQRQLTSQAMPTTNYESSQDGPDYWNRRQIEFYKNTTFKLSSDQMRLLKGEAKYSLRTEAHLPFWFDYKLFKKVFGKKYSSNPSDELERHLIYIKTCVRTLKARVMFRILAATRDYKITSNADLFFEERVSGQAAHVATNSQQQQNSRDRNKILFSIPLLPAGLSDEDQPDPMAMAMRLVLSELARVESRNQLNWYLKQLDEADGSAIDGKLPYTPKN